MASWETNRPELYDVVTGFFPETSPKETWATNPRPLLVCGVAQDPETKTYFCRIAYGTSKSVRSTHGSDLVIANVSILNSLNLKKPTKFVIHSGLQMVILPWLEEFFQPWTGYDTPVLSRLPEDMQRFVGNELSLLQDLPQF
ncbi:hypothetical protein [Pacificibacter sp. AS14]|uniref:hypothetical protein n=1 Tax=Pacificibacter sp. AS14 TaxID=3135785 RepID=UPI0031728FD9